MKIPAILAYCLVYTGILHCSDAIHVPKSERAKPVITSAESKYTGCSSCLNSKSKKYCIKTDTETGKSTQACCDIKDSTNTLCDDRLESVTCSSSVGPDVDGASS